MERKHRVAMVAQLIALSLAVGLGGCATEKRSLPQPESVAAETDAPAEHAARRVGVQVMELYPSQALEDWEAYADGIVLAHVDSERRQSAPRSETATGEGRDLVGREIDVQITKVIWFDPAATQQLSSTVTMIPAGWFTNGEGLAEAVFGGSRLEVGHDYVIALKWYPEVKEDGKVVDPAQWGVIGSGGTLPSDDGTIGVGEYLGEVSHGLSSSEVPPGSVLAEHLGESVDEFIAALADFKRVARPTVVERDNGGSE